jgi:hypothetical protein
MKPTLTILATLLLAPIAAFAQEATSSPPLLEWAGRAPDGTPARIVVPAPENPRFHHLGWPKAVRTADGTIILGYLMGRKHPGENCPAVSLSTDGGKTFSSPTMLREFGKGRDYEASGNMALGLAPDGSVLLLAHGYSVDSNHIFGWRSTDSGRTWNPVDTSALGPNKTGSSTGSIVPLPDGKLMIAGHYRAGSQPYTQGIWCSVSKDNGLTWEAPTLIVEMDGVEPVLVRHENRLLVFIRERKGKLQYIAVSDDWGVTWKTELAAIHPVLPTTTVLAHPFAMVDPHDPNKLLAVTFERGAVGAAQLWRGNPQTLEFKHERTLVELTNLDRETNNDYGYGWLLPMEGRRALLFYYHGLSSGPNSIWVLETEL